MSDDLRARVYTAERRIAVLQDQVIGLLKGGVDPARLEFDRLRANQDEIERLREELEQRGRQLEEAKHEKGVRHPPDAAGLKVVGYRVAQVAGGKRVYTDMWSDGYKASAVSQVESLRQTYPQSQVTLDNLVLESAALAEIERTKERMETTGLRAWEEKEREIERLREERDAARSANADIGARLTEAETEIATLRSQPSAPVVTEEAIEDIAYKLDTRFPTLHLEVDPVLLAQFIVHHLAPRRSVTREEWDTMSAYLSGSLGVSQQEMAEAFRHARTFVGITVEEGGGGAS